MNEKRVLLHSGVINGTLALVVQHEEEHESEPFLSCLYDPL